MVVGLTGLSAEDRAAVVFGGSMAVADAGDPRGQLWTNCIGMRFVRIPSGTFTMGSGSEEAGELDGPSHTVSISRPFYLAMTEVTQAQWRAVFGVNPSRFRGEERPVERVSWHDAREFVRKLSARDGTTEYRLPTEAEWEYACRAGVAGDRNDDLASVAWFSPGSGGRTHRVARKRSNPWGLYDMLGNVYEWCEDWKGRYPSGEVTDPRGPSDGSFRVVRGGSWLVHANRTRSHFRDFLSPDCRRDDVGLRVVAVGPTP